MINMRNRKIKYTVSQVAPRVFLIDFEDQYDMAMTMLRYQEFYESPKFHGRPFTIAEFMDYYSRAHGEGAFTYAVDWYGFNFPGHVLRDCIYKVGIDDWNEYDNIVESIYLYEIMPVLSDMSDDFYVIASVGRGEESSMAHEMAHAFFYLNPDYRKLMKGLVKRMNTVDRDRIKGVLLGMGYAKRVIVDEIQAYMATGLLDSMGAIDCATFVAVFSEEWDRNFKTAKK